jgi:hypothetical protein
VFDRRTLFGIGGLALAAIVAVVLVVASSGGGSRGSRPAAIARDLYAAINRSDDAAVASLFTSVATIDGQRYSGRRQIAGAFAALPCGADIVSLRATGSTVVVRERLHDRPGSRCGSYTGTVDTATMTLNHGKLTTWTHG